MAAQGYFLFVCQLPREETGHCRSQPTSFKSVSVAVEGRALLGANW